jgi:hypothetical protein
MYHVLERERDEEGWEMSRVIIDNDEATVALCSPVFSIRQLPLLFKTVCCGSGSVLSPAHAEIR